MTDTAKPTCRDCVCFDEYQGTNLGACLRLAVRLTPVVAVNDVCKYINTIDDINRRHEDRNK